MSRPTRRGRALLVTAGAAVAATLLSACGPQVEPRVEPGSSVDVAWSGELTSANAASVEGRTPGNLDVAAMTRAAFATVDADGEVREDPSFGTATVVADDPFTVRYDLADGIRWSDGVPIDAADLMLAWAASSNALSTPDLDVEALRGPDGRIDLPEATVWFDVAEPGGLAHAAEAPTRDDWARAIDVRFAQPVPDWRIALDVAVPAHVLGERVFGVTDPMEAKQRVLDAIDRADPLALSPLAAAWSGALGVDPAALADGAGDDAALLSSGPYRLDAVRDGRVELVANGQYVGAQLPQVERIALVSTADDAAALAGVTAGELDVATVRPTGADREAIRDLDRDDATLSTAGDGSRWELVLRADRAPLQPADARRSFLHTIDRRAVAEAALGEAAADPSSVDTTIVDPAIVDSVLFRSGTRVYGYALEDAGFPQAFGGADEERAAAERDAVGIQPGAELCVRYDRADAFASAALPVIAAQAATAGWAVRDCGVDDLGAGLAQDDWHAVLRLAPAPADAAEVVERWRGGGLSAIANPARETLLDEALVTAEQDALEQTLIEIEASLVADAVALPIAEPGRLTISAAGIQGVSPRAGHASLTWNAWEWGVEAPAP
ncbi:ABC transporter substrate-binding protein [Agrococcus sp. DT81.2]|uniref:ABC transporter substrate-binding protein n=1 Tax=Agrococcus sp. DT81.2 TaxID=3393414 RepID=UPI003CE4E29A